MIKANATDSDLPLLLNKEVMKKGDMKNDFAKGKVSLLNQNIDTVFTSNGHYVIPMS